MDGTWAVCSKTDGNTAHGLCDMAGNAYEWVRDKYHDSYEGAPTDGSSWESFLSGRGRVRRGGSFKDDSYGVRTSFRVFGVTSENGEHLGIRCAK
ncbi:formylglycine-generating enzyme family protein [Myxococcota bacterium]